MDSFLVFFLFAGFSLFGVIGFLIWNWEFAFLAAPILAIIIVFLISISWFWEIQKRNEQT